MRFYNLICCGSLASKWLQNLTLKYKTNKNKKQKKTPQPHHPNTNQLMHILLENLFGKHSVIIILSFYVCIIVHATLCSEINNYKQWYLQCHKVRFVKSRINVPVFSISTPHQNLLLQFYHLFQREVIESQCPPSHVSSFTCVLPWDCNAVQFYTAILAQQQMTGLDTAESLKFNCIDKDCMHNTLLHANGP